MKSKILKTLKFVFIILIICSSFFIIKWVIENNQNKKGQEQLNNYVAHIEPQEIQSNNDLNINKVKVDFNSLKNINSDVIA